MTLPTSGQISLSQVNVELGVSATAEISMNSSDVRDMFEIPSGEIELADGYGKPTPGVDLYSDFYEFAQYQVNDSANETNKYFSVDEVQSNYSGTGRLYLVHKSSGTTTAGFYDAPIGCIQVLNAAGTTVNQQWWFDSNNSWQTTTGQYHLEAIGYGVAISPSQVRTGYTFQNVGSTQTTHLFGIANSTPSRDTGANHGIANPSGPMTLGKETIAQSTDKNYMYRETSSSTVGYAGISRSPSRTWTGGERIRMAYIIGNKSPANTYYPDDTFFFGIN